MQNCKANLNPIKNRYLAYQNIDLGYFFFLLANKLTKRALSLFLASMFLYFTNINQAQADVNADRVAVDGILQEVSNHVETFELNLLSRRIKLFERLSYFRYSESFMRILNELKDSTRIDFTNPLVPINNIYSYQSSLLIDLERLAHIEGIHDVIEIRKILTQFSDRHIEYLRRNRSNLENLAVDLSQKNIRFLYNITKKYSNSNVKVLSSLGGQSTPTPSTANPLLPTVYEGNLDRVSEYNDPELEEKTIWDDPEFIKRLGKLEEYLNQHIFDQEETHKKVVSAIKGYQIFHKATNAPVKIMVVGSTGTGKTELAKLISKFLFPEKDLGHFDMGRIILEGDLADVFGSKRPYVGSDKKSRFEKHLEENNSGVLLFDEISNMGGESKERKAALFRNGFYSIMDEGYWDSPYEEEKKSGAPSEGQKRYELKNYILIFTGNDLEGLIRGVSNDKVKEDIWRDNRDERKVRDLLRSSNIPDAFIGRLTKAILQKPLLEKSATKITEKIVKLRTSLLEREGIKIEYSDSFFKVFGSNFMSSAEGARSIIHAVESELGSALFPLFERNGGKEGIKSKTIYLDINSIDNLKPYGRKSDPEFKLEILITLKDSQGNSLDKEILDISSLLPARRYPSLRIALSTAYHEAGHAVLNDTKKTGTKVHFISILPEGSSAGHTLTIPESLTLDSTFHDEKFLISRVAMLMAGHKAEILAGFPASAGWSSDLERIRSLIRRFVVELGLGQGTAAALVDGKEGKVMLTGKVAQAVDSEVQRIWNEAEELCERELLAKWNLVRSISLDLIKNGVVDEKQFNEHVNSFNQEKGRSWVKDSSILSSQPKAVRVKVQMCSKIFSNSNSTTGVGFIQKLKDLISW